MGNDRKTNNFDRRWETIQLLSELFFFSISAHLLVKNKSEYLLRTLKKNIPSVGLKDTGHYWQWETFWDDRGQQTYRVNPLFSELCACSELRKQWKFTRYVCCRLALESLLLSKTTLFTWCISTCLK